MCHLPDMFYPVHHKFHYFDSFMCMGALTLSGHLSLTQLMHIVFGHAFKSGRGGTYCWVFCSERAVVAVSRPEKMLQFSVAADL